MNGREIVAESYWHERDEVRLFVGHGVVGLPRGQVRAINGQPVLETIETRSGGVNAAPPFRGSLFGSGRSVTLPDAMATKDECFDRAVDHLADGEIDQAIAAYQEALAIDPVFIDAIQGIALAYADKEMFDEAIVWGKKFVELAPDETLAHTSLSMFYQRKGMIPEAEAEGAKARMLDWKRQLAEQAEQEQAEQGQAEQGQAEQGQAEQKDDDES